MKKFLMSAALVAIATLPLLAQAQPKPEEQIKYRQGVFQVQARAFGTINAMNKGDVPFNAATAQTQAHIIATVASLPWSAFGAGTENAKTKPEIWSDAAGFKAAQEKFQASAVALEAAAKTGDANQVKTAWGNMGATCAACHKAYRN